VNTVAVFRVEKNHNYTVMSNYHLRDTRLTLKSIGLLSKMLSLTDEWDYTTRGLAAICKEGVDAIGAALKELEARGYLDTENPYLDTPDTAQPYTEKRAQLNKDRRSKEKEIPNGSSTDISNPDPIYLPAPLQGAGCDGMGYEEARELVKENIEYDILTQDPQQDKEQLDEVVDLMAETLCSRRQTIVVAGDEYPAEMVKEKLLRVNSMHIGYVFDCLKQNTTYVRNIKKYLLASLFNAPSTMGSYYSALVNHDMYGDGLRGKG